MADRDRLIELIDGFVFGTQIAVNSIEWDSTKVKELADYLLSNGVIVPPCKVGDTVYVITDCSPIMMCHDNDYLTGTGAIECPFEDVCNFTECNDENTQVLETYVNFMALEDGVEWFFHCGHIVRAYDFNEIGKTVFLTKEEAEAELKKRGKEND